MDEELQQTAESDSGEPLEPVAGDGQVEENAEAPGDDTGDAADVSSGEAPEVGAEEPATVEDAPAEEPLDESSQPAVIDLKSLLKAIPGDDPSGENLRYSGLYDEIADARRADDNLNQGAWQTELKTADYRRVIDLAVPALTTKSKDLQVAAWLSESLVKQHGFVGFRDSLKLVAGLQEKFWETLHPEVDEGDMEGRANAISWMDTQGSLAIMSAPFTGGDGYSFIDWEDSKKFDFPDNLEMLETDEQVRINALKAQAETERCVTSELWKKAIAATRRAQIEQVNYTFDECWAAFKELNRVIEEKYDRNQMPGLSNLKKAMDAIDTQVKKLLAEKRAEEPDEEEATEGGVVNADGTVSVGGGVGSATGAIQGRGRGQKRLDSVAEYFRKAEPHSPVSYLVQRAVLWGNMPLESWLKDVIKDETVLFQLRQTLGFNTILPTDDAPS